MPRYLIFIPLVFLIAFATKLEAGNKDGMALQVSGGIRWGEFEEINQWNALDIGDRFGEEMAPNPFDRGYTLGANFRLPLVSDHFLLVDGGYEKFAANHRTHFVSPTAEDYGIQDFPLYSIRNIPLSVSFLFSVGMGPFDINVGPGIGYQWTRYRVEFPSYGASWVSDREMNYSGSSILYKVTGEVDFSITNRLALAVPISYRFAKVKRLDLESWQPEDGNPSDDVLRTHDGELIPLDLSGYSVGVGLNFR